MLLGTGSQSGVLEQAAGGTLFVGDIEELPDAAHRLLTGVLEFGSYPRDGGEAAVKFDARVIATALPGRR